MSNDRMSLCAALFSPLFVAAVIVSGLGSLSARNLNGDGVVQQSQFDHASAVQHLLFRR